MALPMPFDNPSTYPGHVGIDFAQPKGTIVRASGKGRVTQISFSNTGGWRVWIKYNDGTIKYVHMDSRADILVNVGDQVEYGQPIAKVGKYGQASGNIPASTGYHLHIENGDESGADAVWKIVNRNEVVGEEEMPSIEDILDYNVPRQGGQTGTTNLRQIIAWFDAAVAGIAAKVDSRPDADKVREIVYRTPVSRQGGPLKGSTNLEATIAWLDANFQSVRDSVKQSVLDAIKTLPTGPGVTVDADAVAVKVAQAVADVLAERLKD